MEFRIADTLTDSLARLTGEEQKAVKTTVFDLQVDPGSPGMQLHRIERVKDPNFWSVRVNSDLRLIVHRTTSSLLLCYVGHHGDAYRWAERRKLETHPRTGAAQLVEIRVGPRVLLELLLRDDVRDRAEAAAGQQQLGDLEQQHGHGRGRGLAAGHRAHRHQEGLDLVGDGGGELGQVVVQRCDISHRSSFFRRTHGPG